MRRPTILMCPPDHFGIEYEINPWMSRARGSDSALAQSQWRGLYELLISLGVHIELLVPQPGLPDLVFTANAGLVFGRTFYSSRFKHPERARETPIFDAWFASQGYQVEHLPEGIFFEGAGDALFCGAPLIAGYRFRSAVQGHQYLAQQLQCLVLPVELVDPHFYHLDTCFCPLAPGVALWYPGAFDKYGQKVLQTHVPKLLAVRDEEARRFGCNAVVVGKTVVHNTGCPELARELQSLGYTSREAPLDEFLKSGGSAKCLTLRLDGEDSAWWAQQSGV